MASTLLFWALVVAYLAVFFFFSARFSRSQGYLSAFTVFGVTGFYYYLALPVEIQLTADNLLRVGHETYVLSTTSQLMIALGALLAILGFAVGLSTGEVPREIFAAPVVPPQRKERIPRAPLVFLLLATGLVLAIGGVSVFVLRSYHERSEFLADSSALSQALLFFQVALVVTGGVFLQQSGGIRFLGYLCAAFLCFQGLCLYDKDPILLAMCTISVKYIGPKFSSKICLILILIIASLAVLCAPLFSIYRTPDAILDLDTYRQSFSLRRTDAAGPMVSLLVETKRDWSDMQYGKSYLTAIFTGWIPRIVYPDRPLDLSTEFAKENMANFRPGMGLGYSLLTEAYINFGFPGVFIQYFVLGLLWPRLWALVVRAVQHRNFAIALYCGIGFSTLVICHRGPTNQLVRIVVYRVLPLLLLTLFVDRRLARVRRLSTNRQS